MKLRRLGLASQISFFLMDMGAVLMGAGAVLVIGWIQLNPWQALGVLTAGAIIFLSCGKVYLIGITEEQLENEN